MTLHVSTGRLGVYRGTDLLDITRATADRDPGAPGRFLAPSWTIVRAAKAGMQRAKELRSQGHPEEADRIAARTWARYEPAYHLEMLQSYRHNRDAWEEWLSKETVTFCCVCPTAPCHRFLAAEYFVRLGAVYDGERTAAQMTLDVGIGGKL